jgi:hypothetical protein
MGNHGTAAGEIYDSYGAAVGGGAADIGIARARSMRVDPSNVTVNAYVAALQEGSPYPKFAFGRHDTYPPGGSGTGTFGRDLVDTAAIAGMPALGRPQQYPQQYPNKVLHLSLGCNKRISSVSHVASYSTYP